MKVRKKPVVVDAWKIDDLLNAANVGVAGLPKEVAEAYTEGLIEFEVDRITIATLEGVMTGWATWWLIRGVKGEWYPCDQEAYEQSYEEVVNLHGRWHPVEPVAGRETPIPDPFRLPRAPTGYGSNPEGD